MQIIRSVLTESQLGETEQPSLSVPQGSSNLSRHPVREDIRMWADPLIEGLEMKSNRGENHGEKKKSSRIPRNMRTMRVGFKPGREMTEQQQGEILKEWERKEVLSHVIEDTSDKKSSSPQHLQHHPAVFYHTDVHSVRQADYGL